MAIGIGVSVAKSPVLNRLYEAKAYSARVLADSGEVANNAKLRELILMLKAQGLYDNTKLLIAPVLGGKWRTSGIYKYASKLYSVNLAANDATQTAEVSQPYQSGNIAPTELLSIKNPNGDTRYLSHPAISFAANEAWSVSVMLDWNASPSSYQYVCSGLGGGFRSTIMNKYAGANKWRLSRGANDAYFTQNQHEVIGKATVSHIIFDGVNVKIYKNGIFLQSQPWNDSFAFDRLGDTSAAEGVNGKFFFYRIQSGAMTAGQITAEYNLLRSWIPEIESVQIGTQTWATSNLAAVATPLGNVIPEVQTAGAVEKVVNGDFSAGATGWVFGTGWAYGTNNAVATNSTGILSNLFSGALGKWYKLTVTLSSVTSGSLSFQVGGTGSEVVIGSTNGTYTKYYKSTYAGGLYLFAKANFSGVVDDVSVQELNWSNATEIYDAVYAATSGTAAEKHYAAVKEAAMWCHYDNSTANGAVYNKLYNWYAASLFDLDMASAGYGWHVPTSAEFTTLQTYLGGSLVAGGKMKKEGTTYWNTPNTGADNSSGFTGLPGGYRSGNDGAFSLNKSYLFLYTSDQYAKWIDYITPQIFSGSALAKSGYSIRLIKNT